MALEGLQRERRERVLSIQSHVVHGYAGNKCSVFPLQLHGFEVDFINSVQYSNHAGNVEYKSSPRRYEHVKGQRLTDVELNDLFEGLKLNAINNYTHILTGYCGNVDFLKKVADIVRELKQKNPDTVYVCDPVMGDNGRYYTPKELLPVYREVIAPLADVLTPNAFELGELIGSPINSIEDCFRGIDKIHESGVKTVVVTSGVEAAQKPGQLSCFASSIDKSSGEKKRYRFDFPQITGQFVGTGDVFASLLVVHLVENNGDIAKAVGKVLGSMQGLLKKTSEHAEQVVNSSTRSMYELRLIQSRFSLLVPETTFEAQTIIL